MANLPRLAHEPNLVGKPAKMGPKVLEPCPVPRTDFATGRSWARRLQMGLGLLGLIANTLILNREKDLGPISMDLGLRGFGKGRR